MAILPNNKNKGTGFVNIGDILRANRGYGDRIGSTIGQGLQNEASGARGAAQGAYNTFQSGLSAGSQGAQSTIGQAQEFTPGYGQYSQSDWRNRPDVTNQIPGESSQEYAQRLADSTTNFSQLGEQLANAKYTGPQDIENVSGVRNKIATAQALGQMGSSGEGQKQLLSNFIANRNRGYNRAQSSLDQVLLGKSAQGQKDLRQGMAASGDLGRYSSLLGGARNQAQAVASGIQGQKSDTVADLRNALSGKGDDPSKFVKGLTTQAQEEMGGLQENSRRLKEIFDAIGGGYEPEGGWKPEDTALIEGIGGYGFDENTPLYLSHDYLSGGSNPSNENTIKGDIRELGGQIMTEGLGEYIYNPQEQKAAENLANLLRDSQMAESIKNNEYDSTPYNSMNQESILSGQNYPDEQSKNYLKETADWMRANSMYNPANAQAVAQEARDRLKELQKYLGSSVTAPMWNMNGADISRELNKILNNPEKMNQYYGGKNIGLKEYLLNALANQGSFNPNQPWNELPELNTIEPTLPISPI